MILNAYSIYDSKSQAFGLPFFQATDGLAIRSFSDIANDRQTLIARHPGDFMLIRIGTFDDSVGELARTDHLSLMLATELVVSQPEPPRMNLADPVPHVVNGEGEVA